MSARRFLDTNVLVYACDTSDADKQAMALNLIANVSGAGVGCLSTQVLGEFYHATVVRKKLLTSEEAERLLRDYAAAFSVSEIKLTDVYSAIAIQRKFRLRYWDSLILATAHSAGCVELQSEDMAHGQDYDGVKVVNPFQAD